MHSREFSFISILCLMLAILPGFQNYADASQVNDGQIDNGQAGKTLRFGVAPFMSPVALVKRMNPFVHYLSHQLLVDLQMETSATAADFVKRTHEGRYDVIYTSPTFSLLAIERAQLELVASLRIDNAGVFLVHKDSDAVNLKDLAGKRLGAPPAFGFLGQLAISTIKHIDYEADNRPQMIHFNSHNAAISALRLGEVDAVMIVEFMEQHLRKQAPFYRVIHRTDNYPGLTMLVSNQLDPSLKAKLQQVLLNMDKNPAGKKVLSQISFPGFRLIEADELEKVRKFIPAQQ